MNSRRLMGSPQSEDTPYYIATGMPRCASQQNWSADDRDGSNSTDRYAARARGMSASPRKRPSPIKMWSVAMCQEPTSPPSYSITSSARPSSVIGKISFPLLVDYGCAARSAARTMRLTFLIAK